MPAIKLIRITTVPLSFDKLLTGQLKYMSEHGFGVYMVCSPGDNAEDLAKRESARLFTINMTRTISPARDLISLIKMVVLFIKIRPAIVHTHTPKAGIIGMLAARIANVPVRLHTVAGLPLMEAVGIKRKLLNTVERLTYRCSVKVYPNSQLLKQFIIQNKFCRADKLKVIGSGSSNGIDVDYFKLTPQLSVDAKELRNKYNIAEDDFVYIYVGRLVKDKGIEELTGAFSNIHIVHKNSWLLLVGPTEPDLDPLSAVCMEQIQNNPQIIHAGYQNDVRPYLAISNALVFPSYREGFPNVPMQAGCFDLPCIVTDINGCNEIIEHETNGLIIPVKNKVKLENAMKRMLEEQPLYQKLKKNARKMIVSRYEQTHFWSLLLKEYEDRLAKMS